MWPLAVNDDSVDKILYIFKAHRVPQGPQKVQSCCLISAYVLVSYSNEQYSKKKKGKYSLVSKAFKDFEKQSNLSFITLG